MGHISPKRVTLETSCPFSTFCNNPGGNDGLVLVAVEAEVSDAAYILKVV